MKKFIVKQIVVLLIFFIAIVSCNKNSNKRNTYNDNQTSGVSPKDSVKYKIEFIELGSVNCIPCKKMQPVMKSIEEKYKGLVKVTFHDVWKDTKIAEVYGIDLIPTQVFKDADGKELMRHQGFFAEVEIDKFFQSQGINIPQ